MFIIGFIIGWFVCDWKDETDGITFSGAVKKFMEGPESQSGPKINWNRDNMPIWSIVRYKHNGEYDCVWSSGHTKRDADKICAELNQDYHKNYGKYVVE